MPLSKYPCPQWRHKPHVIVLIQQYLLALSFFSLSSACRPQAKTKDASAALHDAAKNTTQRNEEPHSASDCSPHQASHAKVIAHEGIKTFGNNGNVIQGLATAATGSQQFEVWHSSIAPGGSTPPHTHSSDEVFIILKGEGKVRIGEKLFPFFAPATVVAPAHQEHQLFNTGTIATDQYVIVGACSEIHSHAGTLMDLPWRK